MRLILRTVVILDGENIFIGMYVVDGTIIYILDKLKTGEKMKIWQIVEIIKTAMHVNKYIIFHTKTSNTVNY